MIFTCKLLEMLIERVPRMRQRPPRVHLLIPHVPSNLTISSSIRNLFLGCNVIEFGGTFFVTKLVNMAGPLYINMRSAPETQNTMPRILACPSRFLYLTSSVLKNAQFDPVNPLPIGGFS